MKKSRSFGLINNEKECFQTKEFSPESLICKKCVDYIVCKNTKNKKRKPIRKI